MPASTSTSNQLISLAAAILLVLGILQTSIATGQSDFSEIPGEPDNENEFIETPYTQYGEFDEDEDEAAANLFFQYGRFFGVSVGFGVHGVTGNRALLWEGGFPMFDFRFHYWFDFNFALQLQFFTAEHNYFFNSTSNEVNLTHVGVWIKYYFDTRNLSAPITFANPYIMLGGGSFNKSEVDTLNPNDPDEDSTFGFGLGGGLEFLVSPKKVYFDIQAQIRSVNFDDRLTTEFQSAGVEDLSGFFFSVTGSILFTW